MLCILLAGCATPGEPVVENLDETTGVTVMRLAEPVELVAGPSPNRDQDPFAFVGPFETNRQGARASFLWIGLPVKGTGLVRCGTLSVPIGPLSPEDIGLSGMPYRAPAPWIDPSLTAVTSAWIDCLGSGEQITVEIGPTDAERYLRKAGAHAGLQEFAQRARR